MLAASTPRAREGLPALTARALRSATLIAACAATLACTKRQGPLPLCLVETLEPGATRELPPELWFGSLLPDYVRDTRRVPQPARDCTGAPVAWPDDRSCPASSAATPAPARPLGPDDLVLQPIDDKTTLVWIVTQRFTDGDGLGPAALIEWSARGFVVRAVGPLRAPVASAQLRLEPLGKHQALVVDAERCADGACRPITVLVPLLAGRFTPMSVLGEAGRCDGPAEFDRARVASTASASMQRRFTLSAALRFETEHLYIDEQVVVVDRDPARPEAPDREFRRVAHTRKISLESGRLVGDRAALWPRVVAVEARVDGGPRTTTP